MLLINDLQRHSVPLREKLDRAIARVMDSGWYVIGSEVEKFESEFADYCGVGYCSGVGNGTDALEISLRAVGVVSGDKVITVANAGMYSTVAINLVGAEPVYVDVDDVTMNVDLSCLKESLNSGIKAIIITHLYGRMVDVLKVKELADQFGVSVIEDCAQSHGAVLAERRAGSVGDIGCFSFYPTKNLGALGDGGAIITKNTELGGRVAALRQYGWEKKYMAAVSLGVNSRLDELQAAVLREKLPYLDEWNERRRRIARIYSERLGAARGIQVDAIDSSYVAHLYVIRVKNRAGLQAALAANDIASDVHFPLPDYRQPCMLDKCTGVKLDVTELCSQEVMTLPCFPELTDGEVNRVIDTILMFLDKE